MPRRHVTVRTHNGAHARPVAEMARVALGHAHPVTLRTSGGAAVDVGSVLAVMDLGLVEGDAVTLETADADGADAVLDALVSVLDPGAGQ